MRRRESNTLAGMRLPAYAIALVAAALLGAGCDSDDLPTVEDPRKQQAEERCRAEADKIKDRSARKTALAACEGDQGKAREGFREQCLEQARRIPEPSSRRRAQRACERIE